MIKAENIKLVDINHLVLNPKNNNKHPKEQIDRLIKLIEFQGFRNPVIVSNRTGFVVAGHGRIEAAKKLKMKQVPVIYQDFDSEAQEYAYMTSDNAITSWAELDLSMVNTEMLDLGPEFEVDLLGIKDFVIEPVEKFEPQADEDAVPEIVHPITRKGDLWILGNHRLLCGDSTMIDDVERLINDELIECVYTDPPYGINIDFNEKFAEQNGNGLANRNAYKKIHGDETTQIANDVIALSKSIGFNKMLFWGANYYPENLGPSKCWISWYKKENLPTDTFCDTELAWTNINKHSKTICVQWKGMIKQGESGQKRVHPNQKPVLLARECLKYMDVSGPVIDFFCGSGSTIIACEEMGLKSFNMEYLESYCDVIIKRWEQYTGKKATLESTGQTYEELKVERDGTT
jgi:DNA modification methylase